MCGTTRAIGGDDSAGSDITSPDFKIADRLSGLHWRTLEKYDRYWIGNAAAAGMDLWEIDLATEVLASRLRLQDSKTGRLRIRITLISEMLRNYCPIRESGKWDE